MTDFRKPMNSIAKSNRQPDLALELLSKYSNVNKIPRKPPVPQFCNNQWYPTNLIEICKYIMSLPAPKMRQSSFKFIPS